MRLREGGGKGANFVESEATENSRLDEPERHRLPLIRSQRRTPNRQHSVGHRRNAQTLTLAKVRKGVGAPKQTDIQGARNALFRSKRERGNHRF